MKCCGRELPDSVGRYGCPNCLGENMARSNYPFDQFIRDMLDRLGIKGKVETVEGCSDLLDVTLEGSTKVACVRADEYESVRDDILLEELLIIRLGLTVPTRKVSSRASRDEFFRTYPGAQ